MYGRIDPVVESILTPCCRRMPYDCTCLKTKGLGGAVLNVFCKTGSGGGIDPTCGTGKSRSADPSIEQIKAVLPKKKEWASQLDKVAKEEGEDLTEARK